MIALKVAVSPDRSTGSKRLFAQPLSRGSTPGGMFGFHRVTRGFRQTSVQQMPGPEQAGSLPLRRPGKADALRACRNTLSAVWLTRRYHRAAGIAGQGLLRADQLQSTTRDCRATGGITHAGFYRPAPVGGGVDRDLFAWVLHANVQRPLTGEDPSRRQVLLDP